ncbi:MAG: TolC family protein [Gemmatimonadota bacterium]|nr:TolC family protein [Gemmatimonadota bacterium]
MRCTPALTIAVGIVIVLLPLSSARAQAVDTTGGPELSLDQAMGIATKNSPDHLQIVEARRTAVAKRRSAYGALLPRADAQLQGLYLASGNTLSSNGFSFGNGSNSEQSSYFIGLTYNIGTSTFLNPKIESANVRAADADVVSSVSTVRSLIAQDYFTVLGDQAKAQLEDSLIANAQTSLQLAKAKLQVGSGISLDVSKAEVNLGKQEVAAIKAKNQVAIDRLTLFQHMGVQQPQNTRLTTSFEVSAPTFTVDSVLALARADNPALQAARTRDESAKLGIKAARGTYLPTLQVSTGIGGYTNQFTNPTFLIGQAAAGVSNCLSQDSIRVGAGLSSQAAQCGTLMPDGTLPPAQIAAIRKQNNAFPFGFTRQPFQVTATLSLPIFDNFQREQRVEASEATRNNALYAIRAQELKTTATVTGAYLTLQAQAQQVALQERTATQAREALRLAEERYRVGLAPFLDVSDARTQFEQAESDRINAVYDFHKAFASLEAAVGRPLR